MSYRLVEETPDRDVGQAFGSTVTHAAPFGGTWSDRQYSTRIQGHRIWRCSRCRGLACGKNTDDPPAKCGKCGS